MTQTSAEILASYQVRKTRAQKDSFIAFMQARYPELKVEEGGFPRCRNLVLGDVDRASLILSAHYDTCAQLPFPNFITPKNIPLTILYALLISIPFFAVMCLINWLLRFAFQGFLAHYFLSLSLFLGLAFLVFMGGPPNKHTANDNTSGVVTLCELIESLSQEELAQTAFVFFDHEESGLLGSAFFRKKHKKLLKDKLLINFDCVSDGDNIMLVLNRPVMKKYGEKLRRAFSGAEGKTVLFERSASTMYPSDQSGFPNSVAVAALHRAPLVGLYMSRIHTSRDVIFDESNINLLCRGMKNFYGLLDERQT